MTENDISGFTVANLKSILTNRDQRFKSSSTKNTLQSLVLSTSKEYYLLRDGLKQGAVDQMDVSEVVVPVAESPKHSTAVPEAESPMDVSKVVVPVAESPKHIAAVPFAVSPKHITAVPVVESPKHIEAAPVAESSKHISEISVPVPELPKHIPEAGVRVGEINQHEVESLEHIPIPVPILIPMDKMNQHCAVDIKIEPGIDQHVALDGPTAHPMVHIKIECGINQHDVMDVDIAEHKPPLDLIWDQVNANLLYLIAAPLTDLFSQIIDIQPAVAGAIESSRLDWILILIGKQIFFIFQDKLLHSSCVKIDP